MLRLTLIASIAIGSAALITGLATRSTVPLVATAIGALVTIGAQAVFWSAMRAHHGYPPSGAFAFDAPVVVVRTGSYRWVRHPIYLAYIMAFIAGAIFAAQPWLWVVPLWMLVLYSGAAWQEEQLILSSPMASSYMTYRRVTGAFMPRLRSMRRSRTP